MFSEEPLAKEKENILTDITIGDGRLHVTRASVYVNSSGEDDSCGTRRQSGKNSDSNFINMNAIIVNDCLEDEDTGGVDDESCESSKERDRPTKKSVAFGSSDSDKTNLTNEGSGSDMCHGPGSNFELDPLGKAVSALSTFVEDIENELRPYSKTDPRASKTSAKEISVREEANKIESSNSLDIEKELNDLLGTLCLDLNGGESLKCNMSSQEEDEAREGSRINLAFEATEPNESNLNFVNPLTEMDKRFPFRKIDRDDYWVVQRSKSKSFTDHNKLDKLIRQGKQRMSMIELRNKRKRGKGFDVIRDSERFIAKKSPASGSAFDHSSFIEPQKHVTVNSTQRPRSAVDNIYCFKTRSTSPAINKQPMGDFTMAHSSHQLNETESSSDSFQADQSFNDSIDWSWLEEAMNSINLEYRKPRGDDTSLRVDAECQTQFKQSWRGEEERMRSRATSQRLSDETDGVNSERRIVNESGIGTEKMSGKVFDEGGGTSGGSGWLRQSMRRIRHFNLEDPTRIRSAPPDSLCRVRTENDENNSAVNQNVVNNRVSARNDSNRHVGSEEVRFQRRQSRSGRRLSTSTGRRVTSEMVTGQQDHQQQTQQQQPQAEVVTASSPPVSDTLDNLGYESDSTDRHPLPMERQQNADDESEEPEGRSPLGPWPHGLSSVFAGLSCTLGLFNISRFAVLSVHFGSNFIIQFLILSFLLGIPLLAFHAALGQTLGAGTVDMWKISPLFQGIGVALLLAQALIGIYSIVGVSWMFVYFRDSFITKQDSFRWAEPFRHYRQDNIFATSLLNMSGRLEETVPDYLNVVVLQRHGLTSPENAYGHLKFQLTFNLAVVWMIVFVSLSKGLRSYGKVVYVFSVLPVFGVLIICSKFLGLTPIHRGLFPQTEWSEFFLNAKSWISAATEVMLTWNLLGVATMQVTSHNRSKKKLWRDVTTIILLTLLILILTAFLGNLCHQLISLKGYLYIPSSFERLSTYSFLHPSGASYPNSIPLRHMHHASLVAGERVGKPGIQHESGYQVLRLATELIPATLAILEGNYLSPFWAVLFYFTLILFGIAQQLAIWHCVITGIMAINAPILKSWETTITFFTCAAGFILGLPMTTELGIFVVYFLDYCLGGGWWVTLLTLMEICAILMVRGRPYSGENISIALFGKNTTCFSSWGIPLLTFTWNVILPVALLVMSITIFKSGGYRDLWIWRCGKGDYWPLWTREIGVFIQIIPLLCIPLVGLVQCYRYLSKGPADIFDRLTNLYRPATSISGIADEESATTPSTITPLDSATAVSQANEDPPPKYTPPPSYSTATGTRIAKLLRQSFRRSIRRLHTSLGPDVTQEPRPPPPDYASVLVEINHSRTTDRETNHTSTHLPSSTAPSFTAADVAHVLRCSFRRANNPNCQQQLQQQELQTNICNNSSENLVMNTPENE